MSLLLTDKPAVYIVHKKFLFLLDENGIKNMLPANTSLQNNRCCFHNFVFLSMNWIIILIFYVINQEIQRIWTTNFLMSCYYFICSRWYADILQLFSLQYRCKQYLNKLMHGVMLIKSRGLEKN